jgi:threonine/homoserine/homoserine lactone efflux protein
VQAVLTVLGLGAVFNTLPGLQTALTWVGAGYLCYLGWRLLGAGVVHGRNQDARPLRAWEAAAFQFANPKAWVMAVTVGVVFVPASARLATALPLVFAVLVLVNFPCLCVRTAVGEGLRGLLAEPMRRQMFNAVMALLLAASAVAMVWPS